MTRPQKDRFVSSPPRNTARWNGSVAPRPNPPPWPRGIAAGQPFTDAAHAAGRKSGDAVAHLVTHFNRVGLAAIPRGHGGGQRKQYGAVEAERILREVHREPDQDADGIGTWSLATLQRVLRRASDGLPTISTDTIGCVLHETDAFALHASLGNGPVSLPPCWPTRRLSLASRVSRGSMTILTESDVCTQRTLSQRAYTMVSVSPCFTARCAARGAINASAGRRIMA